MNGEENNNAEEEEVKEIVNRSSIITQLDAAEFRFNDEVSPNNGHQTGREPDAIIDDSLSH